MERLRAFALLLSILIELNAYGTVPVETQPISTRRQGLASHGNLMDTLLYPTRHHNFGLCLPFTGKRRYDAISTQATAEPDQILEDTPDAPQEGETDYAINPPEIGQNDHNYASTEPPPKTPPRDPHEDRLSLLAKLALAKDTGKCFEKPAPSARMGLIITSDETVAGRKSLSPEFMHNLTAVSQVSSAGLVDSRNVEGGHVVSSTGLPTLISTNPRVSTMAGRTFVISTQANLSSPPLQVHRVSSSLTPHIVLRTGVPALQISTTAPRTNPADPNGATVRCVCGYTHTDDCLVQCEQCKTWQHSTCVASANGTHVSSPYLCDQCHPRQSVTPMQRHKVAHFAPNTTNTGIRISRTTALGSGSPCGRVFVTTPTTTTTNTTTGNQPLRQLHLCLPISNGNTVTTSAATNQTEYAVFSNSNDMGTTPYFSLVTRSSPFVTQTQPVRSSKRKQDLVTLTGISQNTGLECVSTVLPPVTGDLADLNAIQESVVSASASSQPDAMGAVTAKCTAITTMTNGQHTTNSRPSTTFHSTYLENSVPSKGVNSLHRLLASDREPVAPHQDFYVNDGAPQRPSPPSSTMSSDSLLSPPLDAYEETLDLRLSERFYHKLDNLFTLDPSSCMSPELSVGAYGKEDVPNKLSALKRCQVVSFDFNRKVLITTSDLHPRDPIVEYRGLCMLMSEYNEMYDYRKHYNPFVLFYKNWSKMALCVDARKFGNEARFIRRSCTPNCEIRHFVSFAHDAQSGPRPQIRLVVFATRPIMRSVELTLPFDFDYTTCRYMVHCACARKACPVTRWFRQTGQLDAGNVATAGGNTGVEARSGGLAHASLLYSRKLPASARGGGGGGTAALGAARRGFGATTQENYSDILTDEYDRLNMSAAWADDRLDDLDSIQALGGFRPHRTFRRASRDEGEDLGYRNISKPRGRGRGRRRGAPTEMVYRTNRPSIPSKIKRTTTRGRPPLSARQFHSNASTNAHHRVRSYRGRKKTIETIKPHVSREAIRHTEEDVTYSRYDIDYGQEQTRSSSPDSCSLNESTRRPHQVLSARLRKRAKLDEMDSETEPEFEDMDDENEAVNSESKIHWGSDAPTLTGSKSNVASYSRSSKTTIDNESLALTKSRPLTNNGALLSDRDMSRQPHRRQRHSSSRDVQSPPPHKPIQHNREDGKKKSREEIWMAEVMRRIERMEKKKHHQQKHRTSSTNESPMSPTLIPEKPESPIASIPSSPLHDKCEANDEGSVKDEMDDVKVDQHIEAITSPLPEESFTSEQSPLGTLDSKMDSPKVEQNTPVPHSPMNGSDQSYSAHSAPTVSSDVPDAVVTTEVTPTEVSQSNKSTFDGAIHLKQPSSPSRNRRRRSQAALLSDGLSGASEKCDTREDRWLKSQLRRIAELEVHAPNQQQLVSPVPSKENHESTSDAFSCINGISSPESKMLTAARDNSHNDCLADENENQAYDDNTLVERQLFTDLRSDFLDASRTRYRRGPSSSTDASSHYRSSQAARGRAKHLANATNAEADCELIVYRTREEDPMAKFSRGRTIVETTPTTPTITTPFGEDSFISCMDFESGIRPSSGTRPATLLGSTPRPSKKRWLTQALLEEDGDLLSNGLTANGDVGAMTDAPKEQTCSEESLIHAQLLTSLASSLTAPSAGPVNPKKRLISQFSGMLDAPVGLDTIQSEAPPDLEPERKPVESDESAVEQSHCPTTTTTTPIAPSTPQKDPAPSEDPTVAHSTPLPPKKAAVEEIRLQEMRKVRVSLSEYRRRRGIAPTTTSGSQKKPARNQTRANNYNCVPGVTAPMAALPLDTGGIDFPLPTSHLSDPNRLLGELGRICPPLKTIETNIPLPTDLLAINPVKSKRSPPQDDPIGLPLPSTLPLSSQPAFEEGFTPFADVRGPRTPSEPPDDDEDSSNMVYVRPTAEAQETTEPMELYEDGAIAESSSGRGGDPCDQRAHPTYNNVGYPAQQTTSTFLPDNRHPSSLSTPNSNITASSRSTGLSRGGLGEEVLPKARRGDQLKQRHFSGDVCGDRIPLGAISSHVRHSSGSASYGGGASTASPALLPPPPPPLPPPRSSNSLVDLATSTPVNTWPSSKRKIPGSTTTFTTTTVTDREDSPTSVDYFIRRDQEIRHWQEVRSHEWERSDSVPPSRRQHPIHPHGTSQLVLERRNRGHHHRSTTVQPTLKHNPVAMQSHDTGATTTRHSQGARSDLLFDVEDTLCRLRDRLQLELDRTKQSMMTTGHSGSAFVDRGQPTVDFTTPSTDHSDYGRAIMHCTKDQ